MSRVAPLWQVLRSTGLAGLRATRDGAAAIRLGVGAAGLQTGVLEALREGPLDASAVGARVGATDVDLLAAWLRVLEAHGHLRSSGGRWSLRPRGRRLLDDGLVRAAHLAFAGYHTGLYRDLDRQLHGGPARRDVAEEGETIAQLSRGFEPFLHDLLVRTVAEAHPSAVLDVGCGSGRNLEVMLRAAPAASGVGIEVDEPAADVADRLLAGAGLSGRASVLRGDVAALARAGQAGGPYDVALLANVVYYLPVADRVALFRDVAGLLTDGGAILVVTTVAETDPFSRHFDLLLRAQGEGMELPHTEVLTGQLTAAGLQPEPVRRLVPGQPLVGVLARRQPRRPRREP